MCCLLTEPMGEPWAFSRKWSAWGTPLTWFLASLDLTCLASGVAQYSLSNVLDTLMDRKCLLVFSPLGNQYLCTVFPLHLEWEVWSASQLFFLFLLWNMPLAWCPEMCLWLRWRMSSRSDGGRASLDRRSHLLLTKLVYRWQGRFVMQLNFLLCCNYF